MKTTDLPAVHNLLGYAVQVTIKFTVNGKRRTATHTGTLIAIGQMTGPGPRAVCVVLAGESAVPIIPIRNITSIELA